MQMHAIDFLKYIIFFRIYFKYSITSNITIVYEILNC